MQINLVYVINYIAHCSFSIVYMMYMFEQQA